MTHGIGPVFRTGQNLIVLDSIVLGLKDRKTRRERKMRKTWRTGRDEVLRQYRDVTGLTFTVEEVSPQRVQQDIDTPTNQLPIPESGQILVAMAPPHKGGFARTRQDPVYSVAGIVVLAAPSVGNFCHEFGHVLGLGHDFSAGGNKAVIPGCMDYGEEVYQGYEEPGTHDEEALREIYDPTSGWQKQ